MNEDRSSISQATSYQAIGEFWDTHDLGEFWEQTEPAEFVVDIRSEVTYYAVEADLSLKVRSLAEQRGVSAETLLNLWVQEKVTEAVAAD
jgi:CopG antitoxin of type II toxin-antitoxin system